MQVTPIQAIRAHRIARAYGHGWAKHISEGTLTELIEQHPDEFWDILTELADAYDDRCTPHPQPSVSSYTDTGHCSWSVMPDGTIHLRVHARLCDALSLTVSLSGEITVNLAERGCAVGWRHVASAAIVASTATGAHYSAVENLILERLHELGAVEDEHDPWPPRVDGTIEVLCPAAALEAAGYCGAMLVEHLVAAFEAARAGRPALRLAGWYWDTDAAPLVEVTREGVERPASRPLTSHELDAMRRAAEAVKT